MADNSKLLDKYKDPFLLLVEAGFVATNKAEEDKAIKLFRASETLNPDNPLPKIGMGYLHMLKLEIGQASKMFEQVLEKDPNNEMAKTFLGLSYTFSTTDIAKGEKLLTESASKSGDPMVKNLASTALDFVDKFVKKEPTPAEVQPKKEEKKK